MIHFDPPCLHGGHPNQLRSLRPAERPAPLERGRSAGGAGAVGRPMRRATERQRGPAERPQRDGHRARPLQAARVEIADPRHDP